MFVHEARRNTFRESRNARMSAMEKSKTVGNALLNPPKLIPAAFGLHFSSHLVFLLFLTYTLIVMVCGHDSFTFIWLLLVGTYSM